MHLQCLFCPRQQRLCNISCSLTYGVLVQINTGLQFTLLSGTLCSFAWGVPAVQHLEPLWWITTVTTVASGVMYMDGSGLKKIERSSAPVDGANSTVNMNSSGSNSSNSIGIGSTGAPRNGQQR